MLFEPYNPLDTIPFNASSPPTLSSQNALSTHPFNTHYQHPLPIHLFNSGLIKLVMGRSSETSNDRRRLCLDIVNVPGENDNSCASDDCYLCLRKEDINALTQCW